MGKLFGNINKGKENKKDISSPVESKDSKKNVFTLPEKEDKKGVLDNIIKQKDKSQETGSILGSGVLNKIKGLSPSSSLKEENYFALAKIAIAIGVVLAVGVHIFFYSQLSESFKLFGVNVFQKWETSKEEMKVEYSDYIQKNIVLAKFELDKIVELADEYRAETSLTKKDEIKKEIVESYNKTKKWLTFDVLPGSTTDQFEDNNLAANDYRVHFRTVIDENIASIKQKITQEKATSDQIRDGQIDIQILKTVKKIYADTALRNEFLNINLEKDFDNNLDTLTNKILSLSKSNYSIIKNIQAKRIDWAMVIDELRNITKKIDPNHDSKKWASLSSISYNSFNLAGDKISISGRVTTKDSKNFTEIADLIDKLEESKEFMNVTKRSFAKAYNSSNKEYFSSLQITLELQEGDDSRDAEVDEIEAIENEIKIKVQ